MKGQMKETQSHSNIPALSLSDALVRYVGQLEPLHNVTHSQGCSTHERSSVASKKNKFGGSND